MIQNPTPENMEEYKKLRKIASKKIRSPQREYDTMIIRNIRENRRNPRLFFEKCRSFKEGFKIKKCIVKDANGCLITEQSNIVKPFRNHFEELLNNANEDGNLEKDQNQEHITFYTSQPELLEPEYVEIVDYR